MPDCADTYVLVKETFKYASLLQFPIFDEFGVALEELSHFLMCVCVARMFVA